MEEAPAVEPLSRPVRMRLRRLVAYGGRLEEAIGQFQVAIELSPHDPFRWAFMSYLARSAHFLFGRWNFDAAAHWARRATQVP